MTNLTLKELQQLIKNKDFKPELKHAKKPLIEKIQKRLNGQINSIVSLPSLLVLGYYWKNSNQFILVGGI